MAVLAEADGYYIRGDWTLQGQVSVGQQDEAAITPRLPTAADRDAQWWGCPGLVGYMLTPRLQALVRGRLHPQRARTAAACSPTTATPSSTRRPARSCSATTTATASAPTSTAT
jgi:hypothetical protein